MRISELIDKLEQIAPPSLADEGDPIGLQVGNPAEEVRRVGTAVDASEAVVDAVSAMKAELLVTHHPLIYAPLRSLAAGDPVAEQALRLVRAGAALYVMHTNYDTAVGGVNDILAERLGVADTSPLTNRKQDKYFKVVVFVPSEALQQVERAMAAAGAGVIGEYTGCSFRTPGVGSFTPSAQAAPYAGSAGIREQVDEYRLEMLCTGSRLERVVESMRAEHPYEEVAFDLYELSNPPVVFGYGRVGSLTAETSLQAFAARVKEALDLEHMRVTGDPHRPVSRVALLGGSGSSLCREAIRAGADVFVTGDVKYHDAQSANAAGLAVIDAGHFETERPSMIALSERLRTELADTGVVVEYVE